MNTSERSNQPAVERRAAEAQLATLVEKFAPEQNKLVATLRRSLQKRLPTAYEIVYEYKDCFVISYSPSEHGYEGVFAIRGSADGVKLYFNQGKGLPDPEKLLKGSANARWIMVEGSSTLTRPAVVTLIDEALARNQVPFADVGRGVVLIRSTANKKSARPRA